MQIRAEQLAAWGSPGLRVVAAGRVKHMSRGMNDVLGSRFADVHAGLGSQKSRALFASSPTPGALMNTCVRLLSNWLSRMRCPPFSP